MWKCLCRFWYFYKPNHTYESSRYLHSNIVHFSQLIFSGYYGLLLSYYFDGRALFKAVLALQPWHPSQEWLCEQFHRQFWQLIYRVEINQVCHILFRTALRHWIGELRFYYLQLCCVNIVWIELYRRVWVQKATLFRRMMFKACYVWTETTK